MGYHMARHVRSLSKVKMAMSQGHVIYQQQKRYNLATDGPINFKLE